MFMYWNLGCVSWPPIGVRYFQVMLSTEGCWTLWTPKHGWSSSILKKFLGSHLRACVPRRDRVAFVLSYNTPMAPSLHGFDHPFLLRCVSLWIHCWLAKQTEACFLQGKNLGSLRPLLPLWPHSPLHSTFLVLFWWDLSCSRHYIWELLFEMILEINLIYWGFF